MLVDRERELTKVVENMQRGVHTLVFGPMGTGKSALLQEAAFQLNQSRPAGMRAIYVRDCSQCRSLLEGALSNLPQESRSATRRPLHSTSRVEGWMRVQDLRDMLFSCVRKGRACFLLDHLPPLHHRMQRLLELLEERFTLACAATASRAGYDLYYWRFDKVELGDLKVDVALRWVEEELGCLRYAGSLQGAIAREVVRLAGGNPGSISETLNVIRSQPRPLDDPIRVRRMFIDGRMNRYFRSSRRRPARDR